MIQRIADEAVYLIRFTAPERTSTPLLMLHGFPANGNVKNLDVAMEVFLHFKRDVYLMHYPGLGESRGPFLFTKSVAEATRVARKILGMEGHRSLHLLGHSWGGLTAINIACALPEAIPALLLLSPFCQMSKSEPLYDWFVEKVNIECPGIFGSLPDQLVHEDFEKILTGYMPTTLMSRLSPSLKLKILQSATDDVTPAARIKAILPQFRGKSDYRELPLDHSFSQDRALLAREVIEALSETWR